MQVCIAALLPTVAALALHKWLQDLHHAVQTNGAGSLPQHVVLVIGTWTHTTAQTPSKNEVAPQVSPEEEQSGTSQAASQAKAVPSGGTGPSSPSPEPKYGRSRSPS
ncbi:hypothetical protein WJX77_007236 [Trebouxia sp. C0004]